MSVTNWVSTRLLSKKQVSGKTFAYEGVVDYVGGRMAGLYIDDKTHAYNNVTCLSATSANCDCCGDDGPPYYNCNTCFYYYLSLSNNNAEAIPSSSFKTSPSGGYYDTSTRKGFKTLGFCGSGLGSFVGTVIYTCATNCAGSATEAYVRANGGSGFFGDNSVAAIKAHDGSLWTWGMNSSGQLGNGNTTDRYSPVQVGTESWKIVKGGVDHFAAIRKDDTLWTWGNNSWGKLGHNTSVSTSSPVQVPGSWKFIAVGEVSMFGIKSDDTLWGWGYNGYGNLGDNSTTIRSSPVQVSGGGSWKFVITDGEYGTSAIKTDGTGYGWGNNGFYQIGDGTLINRSSPVLIAGGFTNWVNISIPGWTWRYGIQSNGTLWTWGHVPFGVSNAVTYRSSPVQVGTARDHASGSSHFSYGGVYLSNTRLAPFILTNGNLISYNGYNDTRTTLYGSGSIVEYIHGSNIGNSAGPSGNYIIKNVKY